MPVRGSRRNDPRQVIRFIIIGRIFHGLITHFRVSDIPDDHFACIPASRVEDEPPLICSKRNCHIRSHRDIHDRSVITMNAGRNVRGIHFFPRGIDSTNDRLIHA